MQINRDYLSKVMRLASRFAPNAVRNINPALTCVRMQVWESGVMSIAGTNSKECIFARLPVEDPKPFAALVPAAMLSNILSRIDDENVVFKILKNHFVIQRKSGDIRLMTTDLGYFPALPPIDEAGNWIEIETEDIHGMVRSLLCGTSEEAIPAKAYQNVAKIRSGGPEFLAMATDSSRMALVDGKCSSEAGIELMVPLRALRAIDAGLNDLKGAKTVSIGEDKKQIWIKVNDNLQFSFTKLTITNYPNIDSLISSTKFPVSASTKTRDLLGTFQLARTVGEPNMRLELKGSKGKIASAGKGKGDLEQEFPLVGKASADVETGFNADYIVPILQRVDTEDLGLNLTENLAKGNNPPTYMLKITQEGERLRSSWIVGSLHIYPGSKKLEKENDTQAAN